MIAVLTYHIPLDLQYPIMSIRRLCHPQSNLLMWFQKRLGGDVLEIFPSENLPKKILRRYFFFWEKKIKSFILNPRLKKKISLTLKTVNKLVFPHAPSPAITSLNLSISSFAVMTKTLKIKILGWLQLAIYFLFLFYAIANRLPVLRAK
jgi:hypothetical protein